MKNKLFFAAISFSLLAQNAFAISDSVFAAMFPSGTCTEIVAKSVLSTAKLKYNRMAIVYNGEIYSFESSLQDSWFCYSQRIPTQECVYALKPSNLITALEILFLHIRDSPAIEPTGARALRLGETPTFEDSQSMCFFQIAMLHILQLSTSEAALDATNRKRIEEDIESKFTVYIPAAQKFIKRLLLYIACCPAVNAINPHTPTLQSNTKNILEHLQNQLNLTESSPQQKLKMLCVLAYLTHGYLPKYVTGENPWEKTSSQNEIPFSEFGEDLKILKSKGADQSSPCFKNAKNYLAAIFHTEMMLYVLKSIGVISPPNVSLLIVSGKCPCPDCCALLSDALKDSFDSSVMIGYNYGWAKDKLAQNKKNYQLKCTQLTPPTKKTKEWEADENVHIQHMGKTPITEMGTSPDLSSAKLYVVGPAYPDSAEVTTKDTGKMCDSPADAAGPCVIQGPPIDANNPPLLWREGEVVAIPFPEPTVSPAS